MKLTHTFELPDAAFELLKAIEKAGSAEYRDTEFETLEEWNSVLRENGFKDSHFLSRNFGGTYYLIEDLIKFNLIEIVDMAWHTTFAVTDIGKEIIEQNS